MERTLVILKPDAIQRGIAGEIISRFEKIGLKIVAMKMMIPEEDLLKQHYPDELIPIVGNKTKNDWDAENKEEFLNFPLDSEAEKPLSRVRIDVGL